MDRSRGTPPLNPSFFLGAQGWPYLLVPFIPLAIALKAAGASDTAVFFSAALGIVPTAALMGRATEELAARSGPGIGGLLNVTFGNAPELIIALFALGQGLHEVVKASLIGSVLGNILLVMGAAMLVGGWGRREQTFTQSIASAQTTMLLVGGAALAVPAVVELVNGTGLPHVGLEEVDYGTGVEVLSAVIAIVLGALYVRGLVTSLRAHADLFDPSLEDPEETWGWSIRTSVAWLAVAGVAVAVMSEVMVGSIEAASHAMGLSEFFIGAVIVAIVGNAAEHWVAVLVARKNKLDLTVNIAYGSGAQVALLITSILVLASFVIGPHPMPMVLNAFELGGLVIAVLAANYVTLDGRTTAREGAALLLVYAGLVTVFALA